MFVEEAKGQLQRIASGLIKLEASPDDQATIDEIFREAHTMKGAAGMVGMMRVSRLAHRLEDLLVELRAGTRRTSPELTDAMLRVVDGMSRLIANPSSGTQDASDEAELERLLPAAAENPPPAGTRAGQAAPVAVIDVAQASPPPDAATVGPIALALASVPTAPALPPVQPVPPHHVEATAVEVPLARIDELNRLVGEASAAQLRMGNAFGSSLHVDPETVTEYRDLTKVLNQLQEVTERTRMVTVGTLEPILHRTARDSARTAGKDVRWEVIGADIEVDRGVLEQLVSPLLHLVRNSIGHGVEMPQTRLAAGKPQQAVVRFQATQVGSKVVIAISDDGAGINVAAVRAAAAKGGIDISRLDEAQSLHLIFNAGISTAKVVTEESGRGVGLDVVATAVAAVHGTVEVVNRPGLGAEFKIIVPITLTVVPCLMVSIAGQSFALPLHRVVRVLEEQHVQVVGGRCLAIVDGVAIPVCDMASLLGFPGVDGGPWVLLGTAADMHAFRVETVLSKRDVVVRGLTGWLRDLKAVTGAAVEPNGSILLVLDVSSLIERGAAAESPIAIPATRAALPSRKLSVMVVDDALMVRELQRSILERAGYAVRSASDGAEALAMLAQEPADLVVTDLEMPNVDGFMLTSSIRAHPRLANIPVLIVSSYVSQVDHQRGLEAGADGYIVKTSFDEAGLLTAVSGLLGRTGAASTGRRGGAAVRPPEPVAPL